VAQEEYFGSRRYLANSAGRFQPAQFWHPDIEHHYVRVLFLRSLYGLQPIRRLTDDL